MKIGSPFPKSTFVDSKKTEFVAKFEFVGTIDSAPYLCIPTALAWRQKLGGEELILKYCETLAQEGAKLVAKELGTEVLENQTETLGRCCLSNVRLPISVPKAKDIAAKAGIEENDVGSTVRDWIGKVTLDEYATFIQTFFHKGAWWVRFSGQVYLEMKDMEFAAETLKEVCERVEAGEWAGVEKASKL